MLNYQYHVIHLTTVHNPYDTRILRRECATLAEQRDYQVTLLNGFGIRGEFRGVNILPFDDKKRSRIGRFLVRGARAYWKARKLSPDVLHIHDPELIWIGLLIKLNGSKVIYDVHEDYEQKIESRKWLPRALRPLMGKLYKLASVALVRYFDGTASATDLIRKKQKAKINCAVHNYPRFLELSQTGGSAQRESKTILYTGGLTQNRGIAQVLQALHAHVTGDWKLIIVGKADPAVEKGLVKYLQDHRVDYRGKVSFEDVKVLLGTCSIGVVCNQPRFDYQNALPNKLFEYMAAGLAVVCSDFDAWKEIVEQSGAGFSCDTTNIESIGATLDFVLRRDDLAKECGMKGKNTIKEHYSWEKEEKKLLALYEEIFSEC